MDKVIKKSPQKNSELLDEDSCPIKKARIVNLDEIVLPHSKSEEYLTKKEKDKNEEYNPFEETPCVPLDQICLPDSKKTDLIDPNVRGFKIQIKPLKPVVVSQPTLKPISQKVNQIFNQSDESDGEEMPTEARIRMRNKGRDTPTSSGPNSFGKSRLGFLNHDILIKRQFDKVIKTLENDDA